MDDTFCYLNTDLDLRSADDLTALAAAFELQGLFVLHVSREEDGLWYTSFESGKWKESQPESDIAAMLVAVESLEESLRFVWSGCTLREFNIGYDCGSKPWAFNHGLTRQLLERMAATGASLRITLYPPAHEKGA